MNETWGYRRRNARRIVKSYPGLVHRVEDSRVIAKNQLNEQVGLVSEVVGYEPAHAGFVGDGMLSAAVLGMFLPHRHLIKPTSDQRSGPRTRCVIDYQKLYWRYIEF